MNKRTREVLEEARSALASVRTIIALGAPSGFTCSVNLMDIYKSNSRTTEAIHKLDELLGEKQ